MYKQVLKFWKLRVYWFSGDYKFFYYNQPLRVESWNRVIKISWGTKELV